MLDLASQAETFFWERIESRIMSDDREEKRYKSVLDYFGKKLEKEKEMLPSTCRIGGNIFTYMAVIGGKIYSNNHKNMNHVLKDSKYLVSVIITLGKYISRGETVFYDGVKTSDLGSRAHILKHLRGIMIFGPFEKKFHEGTFWSGY